MAIRYSGPVRINIKHVDGGPLGYADYEASFSLNGKRLGKTGVRLGLTCLGLGIAADSADGYDVAARHALKMGPPSASYNAYRDNRSEHLIARKVKI